MPTAKEMFERLDYKKRVQTVPISNNESVLACIIYKSLTHSILFLFGDKTYVKCSDVHGIIEEDITIDEHKAIHQQMKELGWLDAE